MGLIDSLKKYRDRMTGKAEEGAREKAMSEATDLFEFLMDEMGWDQVSGANVGELTPRTAKNISFWTRRNIRKFREDGYVQRGVNLHTDFVFGKGIDVPKCKSETVQDLVNDLWWSTRNQRNLFSFRSQQTRHKETNLSGELNLLIKVDPKDSVLKIYPLDPQDIEEVIPDPEEPSRPAFYLVRHYNRNWNFSDNQWGTTETKKIIHRSLRYKILEASQEELDRGLVYHVGLNEFFKDRRGSSFVQTIFDAADEAQAMADDGAALSHANAEVGWKSKIAKGGKNVKDAILEYFKTKTDGSNPARAAGSEWAENGAFSRDWVTQRDTGAHYRKEDMRALKLYLFAGLGFGEHYMGDASTGNLATATAMELPVIKMIQGEQRYWESIFADIIDFQIDVAVLTGRLSGRLKDADELETEPAEDTAYQISFPPIIMKELDRYVSALTAAVSNGFIPSPQAARLVMEAFEVQEIDEALEELSAENDIEKAMRDIQAQTPGTPPVPEPAGGKNPASGKEEPGENGEGKEAAEGAEQLAHLLGTMNPAVLAGTLKGFRGGGNGNGKNTYRDILK